MKLKNKKKNMRKAFWNKGRMLEFHIPITLEEIMQFRTLQTLKQLP